MAHVERTVAETGDWRAAIDGLRPVTAQLWRGLSEDDRRTFLTDDARAWDVRRHRMPPVTAAPSRRHRRVPAAGSGTPARSRRRPRPIDGVRVTLTDGTELTVAAVVNCTGPVGALAKDPLLAALTQTGLVRPGPSGLGIDTADDGRVLGVLPPTIPFYAIGTLRRGNLWETTAMPEIREQAYDVARSVWRALHGEVRRRPVDPYGLTLTTNRKAASAVQPGARPAALPAGRRGAGPRVGGRRSTPASRRRTPRWPCSATSGVPSARGARPSRPPTPRPPSATSTTARSASSTP